jgi:hypothetical protein
VEFKKNKIHANGLIVPSNTNIDAYNVGFQLLLRNTDTTAQELMEAIELAFIDATRFRFILNDSAACRRLKYSKKRLANLRKKYPRPKASFET